MNRSWFIAIAIFASFLSACNGRADVMPFIPRERVNIKMRFENLTEYPAFSFYLKSGRNVSIAGQDHPHQCLAGRTAHISGWGLNPGAIFLAAVPRGEPFPGPAEGEDRNDWLPRKLPGALQSEILPGIDGALSAADNGSEVVYRVRIEDEVLTVEIVDIQRPPQYFLAMWCIGAGFLSVALIVLGFVVVRKLRRVTPPAANVSRWSSV